MDNTISTIKFIEEAHDHSKGKVCTVCNIWKPFSEFHKKASGKNGIRPYCKSCSKEYQDNICPFKKWFTSKKGRTKYDGIEFTIEPTDIPGVKIRKFKTENGRWPWIWEAIEYPKVCPVLGIKLDWGRNGHQPNSPSLDRIDNTKGYIPGNVMIMSNLANKMKSNSTPEQLNQFSRYYLFGNKNGS